MLIVHVCVLLLLVACPVWSVRRSPAGRSTLNLRLPDWNIGKIYSSFTESIGGRPAHRRPSRPKPKPKPNRWSDDAYERQLDDYYWHNYYYNQALWQQYEHPHYYGGAWPAPSAAPPRIQQDITESAFNAAAELELAEAVPEGNTNTEQQLELALSVPELEAETTPERVTTISPIKVVDKAATNVAVESIIQSLIDVVLKTSDVENTVEQPVTKDVPQIAAPTVNKPLLKPALTTHTKNPTLLPLNQDEITRVKPDFVIAIIPVNTVPVNAKETKIVPQKIVQATATAVNPQPTNFKVDYTVRPYDTLTISDKLEVETVKPHEMTLKVNDAIKSMLTGSGAQIVTVKPHEMTQKKDDTFKPMLATVIVKTGETVVTTKQPSSNAQHTDDGLSNSQKKDETVYVKIDEIAGTTTVKPTTTTLIIEDAKKTATTNVKPAEIATTVTVGSLDEKAATTEPQTSTVHTAATAETVLATVSKDQKQETNTGKLDKETQIFPITTGKLEELTLTEDLKDDDGKTTINPIYNDKQETAMSKEISNQDKKTSLISDEMSSSATSSLQPIEITSNNGVLVESAALEVVKKAEPSNDETVTALPAAIKAAETPTPSAVAANQTNTMALPVSACIMFPQLPDCQSQKSQQQQLDSSMPFRVVVHRNPEKHIAELPRIDASTQPPRMSNTNATLQSVTALCRYFPNLCTKPSNAQFVRLTDGHGTPLILVTPGEAPKQSSQKPASLWQPVRMRNETN